MSYTTQEKIAIVQQSFEPGMTVSWCSSQPVISLAATEGSLILAAGEQVVPAHCRRHEAD